MQPRSACQQTSTDKWTAFVGVEGQGASRSRVGHQGSELLVPGLIDGHVSDRSVLRLPDELDVPFGRQCGQDCADVGLQVGPDGQQGARAETGAHCVEVFVVRRCQRVVLATVVSSRASLVAPPARCAPTPRSHRRRLLSPLVPRRGRPAAVPRRGRVLAYGPRRLCRAGRCLRTRTGPIRRARRKRSPASSRHRSPCSRSMTRISSRATARETSAPSW